MDPTSIVTGGGVASLLAALAYIGKMLLDWKRTPNDNRHSAVNDAASANAILGETLKGLQAENVRLTARNERLEAEAEEKDAKIEALEARLNEMQRKHNEALNSLRVELSALKGHD